MVILYHLTRVFILCKLNISEILILQMVDMVEAMVTVVPIGMVEVVSSQDNLLSNNIYFLELLGLLL